MPKYTKFIGPFFAATLPLVMSPYVASAQEAASEETEDQSVTDDGLALGEPVDQTLQPGDTYVREKIDDWSLRCVVAQAGEDSCQLYQLLSDDAGQAIAEFTMLKLPEGSQAIAAGTIIVPLETSLQNQLSIQVDDQSGKRYPFAFCNTIGCYARIGLTEEDISSYRKGSTAVLSIVPMAAPDLRVTVTLSLKGFTAAFEKVDAVNPDG